MWRVLTGVCVAFVALFGAWEPGLWRARTDGGARVAGGFMVALAAANVIV